MKRKKVPMFAWLYRVAYCIVAPIWRLLRDAGCDSPQTRYPRGGQLEVKTWAEILVHRCIVTFITHHGFGGTSISSSSTCSHEAATIMTMLVGPERRAMNQTSAKTTLLAALKCGFFFVWQNRVSWGSSVSSIGSSVRLGLPTTQKACGDNYYVWWGGVFLGDVGTAKGGCVLRACCGGADWFPAAWPRQARYQLATPTLTLAAARTVPRREPTPAAETIRTKR